MDYQGQALCEKLYQLILTLSGLVGFTLGYVEQSFWLTFLWCVGGFVVAAIVCVPDWPIYRRHPLAWQPHQPLPGEKDASGALVKDTNVHCGTCACGVTVHGVGKMCEVSSEEHTGVETEEEGTTEAEAAATTATDAASPRGGKAATSAQETKARSGKKSK